MGGLLEMVELLGENVLVGKAEYVAVHRLEFEGSEAVVDAAFIAQWNYSFERDIADLVKSTNFIDYSYRLIH